jgi:hypothetical protein
MAQVGRRGLGGPVAAAVEVGDECGGDGPIPTGDAPARGEGDFVRKGTAETDAEAGGADARATAHEAGEAVGDARLVVADEAGVEAAGAEKRGPADEFPGSAPGEFQFVGCGGEEIGARDVGAVEIGDVGGGDEREVPRGPQAAQGLDDGEEDEVVAEVVGLEEGDVHAAGRARVSRQAASTVSTFQ